MRAPPIPPIPPEQVDRHRAAPAYRISPVSQTGRWRVVCACPCHDGESASEGFETAEAAERCAAFLRRFAAG